jgi:endonuclease-3
MLCLPGKKNASDKAGGFAGLAQLLAVQNTAIRTRFPLSPWEPPIGASSMIRVIVRERQPALLEWLIVALFTEIERTHVTNIHSIIRLLEAEYGTPARGSVRPTPVDELVSTILSQHTSDTNTARAYASLKQAFPNWDEVIDAPTQEVADAIRSGGLANQKAPRIQNVLANVREQRSDFDLRFLNDLPVDDALTWLTALHGVGPKTAACVLLFSLNRPVMPVDTHVHRVGLRLGLLPAGTTAERAHGALEIDMSPDEVYTAHMLLIQHGRRICKARAPRCAECVLRQHCPSAELYLAKEYDVTN